MNTDFNLTELFDRYLENDLNIIEKQAFELRIKEDFTFSERFKLHKEVDKALVEDDILGFRRQLERIGNKNSELLQSVPMILSEEVTPEVDNAILQQDVMALRDQLNRIHSSVVEEVDAVEISGYSGIEQAILSQDTIALNRELGIFEDLMTNGNDVPDLELTFLNQDVDNAILQDDVMDLRAALSELGDRATAKTKTVRLTRRTITYASTAIAAVFILVFAGGIFLSQNSSSVTSDRVFASYFQPYEGISTKRGPSEDGTKIMDLGIQKYNDKAFGDALDLFKAILTDTKGDQIPGLSTILFYAGSCALNLGDPDQALGYFANWDEADPVFEHVEWFTAGCYIKKNDIEKAKVILKKIADDPEQNHHDQAIALLKKI